MTSEPITRLHVSGHRFLLCRIESALRGKGARALRQGAPGRALAGGGLLAAVAVAGCALLGSLRPPSSLPDAPIIMGAESGALYVRLGETLHPVLNLASARLIAATPAAPQPVGEFGIGRAKRGPLLGIAGAPPTVPRALGRDETTWALCDTADPPATTVIIGEALPRPEPAARSREQTALVAADAQTTYLLYGGWRAVVDLGDPVVVGALHLDGVVPRPVSRLLLDALPEAPPIVAPTVPGAGQPGPATLPGASVGSVVRVPRIDADDYYVVLGDGIQPVGQVTAELLRLADAHGRREIVAVAPDVVRTTPRVHRLPVAALPDRSAPVADDAAVFCVTSMPSSKEQDALAWSLGAGLPLPPGQAPVALAQADGDGPALDAVYMPAARSAYVRAADTRYLITDTGVRFAIHDDDAAGSLGLPATAVPAPWPMVAGLPQGPELSRGQSLIARDVVWGGRPPNPAGQQHQRQYHRAGRRADQRRDIR